MTQLLRVSFRIFAKKSYNQMEPLFTVEYGRIIMRLLLQMEWQKCNIFDIADAGVPVV